MVIYVHILKANKKEKGGKKKKNVEKYLLKKCARKKYRKFFRKVLGQETKNVKEKGDTK